jgi:hypothetical protein
MALCPLLADNDTAMAMMRRAQPMQRRPNLMLAALHCSLLQDPQHELARWFPTIGGSTDPSDPMLATSLDSFIESRADELVALVDAGATQTNEPGRSGVLFPVLATIAEAVERPIGLVDVGTSAGLNLRLDHYQYTYRCADGDLRFGDPGSPVHIVADAVRSTSPLPASAMQALTIGHRVGLDLNPLDVHDAQQATWLQALVWPDEPIRHARLAAALDLARKVPVDLHAGDAVERVEDLVRSIPADLHAVVTTTWVMTYLPTAQRQAFGRALERVAEDRPLSWVFIEHPAYAAELPYPPTVDVAPLAAGNPVIVQHLDRTGGRSELVAMTHPHGTWIEWLGA